MGQVWPTSFAPRGVQAIVMDAAYTPRRNELRESGDEVRGVPEGDVLLEVGVVGRMINDLPAGSVVAEFLQREGSPGDVLSKGLSGFVIAPIETHGVVDGEPRMSPAQEVLGKRLCDKAQLQEQADGALAQALGEPGGIMDGEVVELTGGVESALKDESVEVRVEPKRVPEWLIGDDGGGGNGLASGRAVELRDQAEDQPCKVGEQALVMAQEDPEGLGQGEDKLPVGEGKEQLLIEVLGEQEGSFLAA